MISILLNSLRLALWTSIWFILKNIPCTKSAYWVEMYWIHRVVYVSLKIFASQRTVKCYFIMILIYIFLWTIMLNIFSCSEPSMYLFEENVFSSCCPLISKIYIVIKLQGYHIFGTQVLCQIYIFYKYFLKVPCLTFYISLRYLLKN